MGINFQFKFFKLLFSVNLLCELYLAENCLKPSCSETTELADLMQTSQTQSDEISQLSAFDEDLSKTVYDLQTQIEQLTAENEQLKQENLKQDSDIEELKTTLTELESIVNELFENVTDALSESEIVNEEVLSYNSTLSNLEAQSE